MLIIVSSSNTLCVVDDSCMLVWGHYRSVRAREAQRYGWMTSHLIPI